MPAEVRPLPSLGVDIELVEETVSRRRLLLHPSSSPPVLDTPPQSSSGMMFINLTTLGLESILPPNSKDFVVAAVKLVKSVRDREEKLKAIDGQIEVLRTLISSYNSSNTDVDFSSSLFDSVHARYQATPTVGEYMNAVVVSLISQETPL
jgi:hypothetical protein